VSPAPLPQPGKPAGSLRIWFVPTNSSHVLKNRRLLHVLQARGHQVRLLSLDEILRPEHASGRVMREAGLPVDAIAGEGLRVRRGMLGQSLQRRPLRRLWNRFLVAHKPDALVFGADTGVVSRTFIRAAVAHGVPTAVIPDGLVLPENPTFREPIWTRLRHGAALRLSRWLCGLGPRGSAGADIVLVMNATGKKVFVDQGVPPDRVVVVGSPEYDELHAQVSGQADPDAERRLRERLGLPPEGPVVLYAHQPLPLAPGVQEALLLHMIEGCRQAGAALLVKFHPRRHQDLQRWRDWARARGLPDRQMIFARDECTSVEAVRLCSACATAFSTVALEALVCGRPVVALACLNAAYRLPYAEQYGAALAAASLAQVAPAIVAAVSDPATRQRLVAAARRAAVVELAGLDGRSAERTSEAIEALVAARRGDSAADVQDESDAI